MNPKNRAYLVDTQNLSPSEREKTKELLDFVCWMNVPIAKKPRIFMAHTTYSDAEFAAVPFPEGCIITDVTGHDLMAYC